MTTGLLLVIAAWLAFNVCFVLGLVWAAGSAPYRDEDEELRRGR